MAESNYLEVEPKAGSLFNVVDDPEPIEMDEPSPMSQVVTDPGNPGSKSMKPREGFCVKAKTTKNKKVFINVCHSPDIPAPPASINIPKLIAGVKSERDALYRFPLSLGELHLEKDRKGIKCQCYDVVVNSDYYGQANEDAVLRDFIMTLACSGLERKYKISIDISTCNFLNKPYHGTMPPHFIRLKASYKPQSPPVRNNGGIVMPLIDSSRLRNLPQPEMCDLKLFDVPIINNLPLLIFQGSTRNIDGKSLSISVSERKLTVRMRYNTDRILAAADLPHPVAPYKSLANYWKHRLTIAMFVKPQPRVNR